MANVSIKNFTKKFRNVVAVDNLNIEIEEGAFAVLLGPSGCGKTTTLRAIAGLEKVTAGEIYIGDRLVNDLPPKDRDIAMVFQSYALYPHMNVFENMAFGLKLRKMPKKEIEERVREAASILGLEDYLARKPRQLSGGQRQRVAVGRAIVRKPKVFLFDEPLSNLDAKLRVQMRAELSKLHKKLGTTVVYVTHDQIEAMTMATQMFVMKDGVLQQEGHPLEIYKKPDNVFVGGFIGSPAMNFLRARIDISENKCFAVTRDFKIPLSFSESERSRLRGMDGQDVILGIRPESIIVNDEDPTCALSFKTKADVIEPLGDESYIHFSLEDLAFIAKTRKDVSKLADVKIKLSVKDENIHVFEKQTQLRI
ncbi:MAG: ABC transporter ATP-binding protein [Aminivibrio sp.]|jgi:multiple sugar transport system ATP-binding protein